MDLGQFISENKELVDVVAGFVTVIAFAYTVAEGLERRSLESKRDKLLIRIQGLLAVRQEVGDKNVQWQLEASRTDFARVSQRLAKHSQSAVRLGFFRHVFLLDQPPNTLAWIPLVLYWLNIVALGFYIATRWHERDSATVLGLLFYLGMLLLVRQWSLSGLMRGSPENNSSVWPNRFWSLAEYLYWFMGVICLGGAIKSAYSREIKEAVVTAAAAIVMLGCAVIVDMWAGIFMDSEPGPPSIKRAIGLLPPAGLTVACIVNFAQDWRSFLHDWAKDPSLLLFLVAIIAVPWHAGLSYVYSEPVPTAPPAATVESGSTSVTQG